MTEGSLQLGPLTIDRRLLTVGAVLVLVLYGYEIFDFTLSIDEELHTYQVATARTWALQGRWAMAALDSILPGISGLPFLATVLFASGLAISAATLAPVLGRTASERLFFVALFVGSPIWPHIAEFNSLSYGIGFGLVLIALALTTLQRPGFTSVAMSALWVGLATGIYQALLLTFATLGLFALALDPVARREEDRDARARRFLRLGAGTTLGIVFYASVNFVVKGVLATSNTYVDQYFRLSEFFSSPRDALRRTTGRLLGVIVGTDTIFLGSGHWFIILAGLGALGLLHELVFSRREPLRTRLCSGGLVLLGLGLALSPIVISAGTGPVRTLVAVPVAIAAIGMCSLRLSRWQWPQWSVLAAVTVTSVLISLSLFYSDAIARRRDELTAGLLAKRIYDVATPGPGNPIPFVVFGALVPIEDQALRHVEVFGASFFSHEDGNPWRIALYLRLLGIDGLAPEPITSIRPFLSEAEALSDWPAPGSVALVRGKLVVKLGPMSRLQKRAIDAASASAGQ